MEISFRRYTGSELVFELIDQLVGVAKSNDPELFPRKLIEKYEKIMYERPASMAALNILRYIANYYLEHGFNGLIEYCSKLRSEYDSMLWKSADVASRRVNSGERILTNSNSLAIRRLLKLIRDHGKDVEVYVTESKPGKEGLLLAEYAESLGFKVYLMVDSAVRFFMKNVDKVFVGAEAIASNGAVVSKIGTSLISLIAHEARKRVFTVAPSLKFSYETIYGELMKVPEGGVELILEPGRDEELPEGFTARIPLYDVTPSEYIDAIATEHGLIAPQAIPLLLRSIYGAYPPVIPSLHELFTKLREKHGLR
ncbi:MAG: translation initiation factor eIF-2B [Desulfurococcaceae archaeon]|jgi:translation initiation factor eIF-2B subunit delta